MRARRWVAVVLALVALLLLGALLARGRGISARRTPTGLEERIAKAGWRFLIPREYRTLSNPIGESPDVLQTALEHWAAYCSVCHGNDGSGDTPVGRNLHPRAPDMRAARTQALTDGELFYAIEEGIPFTGMPAWKTGTAEGVRASWELVRFIRHLPRITERELQDMEALKPRSPKAEQQKNEFDEFLKGKGK